METVAAALPNRAAASDRIAGFDLLRGICALAVAIYHVLIWHNAAHLYTWGTYGVYCFFVLSGASMYVAYAERFERSFDVGRFLALRLIRLAPLYLLGLFLAVSYKAYQGALTGQHVANAVLNLGFLFSVGNPGTTSGVVGGWSIGIEFAFYLAFPALLALVSSRHWAWFVLLAFAAQHVFINTVLSGSSLVARWGAYTQPLAFVFYFVAGCAIGRAVRYGRLPPGRIGAGAFIISLAAIGVASGGASEHTLSGTLGMSLSLLTVVAVASAATLRLTPAGLWASSILGRASYGVYILHPWIWVVVSYCGRKLGADWVTLAALTLLASAPAALAVEKLLERPVQRYLKARLENASAPA